MNRTDLFAGASRYFELMDAGDKSRAIEVFSVDAVVVDDGRTYRGRSEISGWLAGPASAFTTTSTRLSVDSNGSATVVTVRLEGNFPGSPVDLRHEFVPDAAGLVDSLVISA